RRIVGVVADVDDQHIIPAPSMTIYQPSDQEGWSGRLFVHTPGDPYNLVKPITHAIQSMAADQPVERASSLADVRAEVLTPDRLNAIVFGGFAAVALAISIVGVAGVLAFSVSGRTREFGIRMAMGAQPSSILRGVLADGFFIAAIGVGAGILAGLALLRLAMRYITAIQQPGAISFIASAAVILLAALIAAAIPAARASRVNPMEALRNE
ncbi:MAG TPA: FtsX-like permease family protein, partial [Acidobacteriaceae bacterium]